MWEAPAFAPAPPKAARCVLLGVALVFLVFLMLFMFLIFHLPVFMAMAMTFVICSVSVSAFADYINPGAAGQLPRQAHHERQQDQAPNQTPG